MTWCVVVGSDMVSCVMSAASMAFTGKQGWLYKQGGKRKTWKQRYFVLSPGTFAYYSNKGVRGGCVSTTCLRLS